MEAFTYIRQSTETRKLRVVSIYALKPLSYTKIRDNSAPIYTYFGKSTILRLLKME